MLETAKLRLMLEMQTGMNAKINPEWVKAKYPFLRAVMVEAGELLDHLNFKWWSKKEPDMQQARMELIDIWHFLLSHFLQVGATDFDNLDVPHGEMIDRALQQINNTSEVQFVVLGHSPYMYKGATLFENIDALIGLAALRGAHAGLFGYIMQQCGMNWEDLYKMYVGKNVLNYFRQDHGYKTGGYIKLWGGQEDNIHLVDILNILDADRPTFKEDIYDALENRYNLLAQ